MHTHPHFYHHPHFHRHPHFYHNHFHKYHSRHRPHYPQLPYHRHCMRVHNHPCHSFFTTTTPIITTPETTTAAYIPPTTTELPRIFSSTTPSTTTERRTPSTTTSTTEYFTTSTTTELPIISEPPRTIPTTTDQPSVIPSSPTKYSTTSEPPSSSTRSSRIVNTSTSQSPTDSNESATGFQIDIRSFSEQSDSNEISTTTDFKVQDATNRNTTITTERAKTTTNYETESSIVPTSEDYSEAPTTKPPPNPLFDELFTDVQNYEENASVFCDNRTHIDYDSQYTVKIPLEDYNEKSFEIYIQHRVLCIVASNRDQTKEHLEIIVLPPLINTYDAMWWYSEGVLQIYFSNKDSDSCIDDIDKSIRRIQRGFNPETY
jgi:hypothetical protein